MMRPLLFRAAQSSMLLLVVSAISFALLHWAPGDVTSELRMSVSASPQTVAALRTQYGLDRPVWIQYGRWLGAAVRLDFGDSSTYNLPASSLLIPRALNTLLLTMTATLLAWLIAVPFGVSAAVHTGSWFDRVTGTANSALIAIPDLFLSLALLLVALRVRLLPIGGMGFDISAGWTLRQLPALLSHMILPVFATTLLALPIVFRHVRSSMLVALAEPSIQSGRALGMRPRVLVWRYAFRSAANPISSLFGLSLASLLSASLVVEIVMAWPGLGPLLLEATLSHDINVVLGAVMLATSFLLAGNMVSDLLLYWADPRIREAL